MRLRLLLAPAAVLAVVAPSSLAAGSAPTGVVRGSISVTGAPGQGLVAGVEACPASTPPGPCAHPRMAEARPGAPYTLVLAAGTWRVTAFYLPRPYGGMAVSKPRTLTVPAGQTVTFNRRLLYRSPGTAVGALRVTGVPQGVNVTRFTVVACPPGLPPHQAPPPPSCASEFSGEAGGAGVAWARRTVSAPPGPRTVLSTYALPLPPGRWELHPSFTTLFGTETGLGTTVKVVSGARRRTPLSVAYTTPTRGALTGTASIIHAPPGFSGVVGVEGCKTSPAQNSPCSAVTYTAVTGAYALSLKPGAWWAIPFYVDFTTGATVTGSPVNVAVRAGRVNSLDLSVAYR